jgi:hypothetical protein
MAERVIASRECRDQQEAAGDESRVSMISAVVFDLDGVLYQSESYGPARARPTFARREVDRIRLLAEP